jgi:FKBP-type peptidyl-prolyl cis-trans isomerase FkpA
MHASRLRYLALASLSLAACQQPADKPVGAMSDDEKALYAFGAAVGLQLNEQVAQLRLGPGEIAAFQQGFGDVLEGRGSAVDIEEYQLRFQSLAEARINAGAEQLRAASLEYLAEAAAAPGAVRTGSGLVYRTLSAGSGERPDASDRVRVHYQGTLTDGKIFDSSLQRGQPVEFALDQVIPCWTEGVQRMQVGEKAQLVCPSDIAYGDRGAGRDIPPGATLVFEVELLAIVGD